MWHTFLFVYVYIRSWFNFVPKKITLYDEKNEVVRSHDLWLWNSWCGLWKRFLRDGTLCHMTYDYNNREYTYITKGSSAPQWPPYSKDMLNKPLGFNERTLVILAFLVDSKTKACKDVTDEVNRFLGPLHDFQGCAWKVDQMFPTGGVLVLRTLDSKLMFTRGQYVVL